MPTTHIINNLIQFQSILDQYKEEETILSDFNQKKLEMDKINKSNQLNAKLVSMVKNYIFNFLLFLL